MIVVCGEASIDLVPAGGDLWRALPGGSPSNTAVALARLGTPTAMLARLSGDAFGAQLRRWREAAQAVQAAVTAHAAATGAGRHEVEQAVKRAVRHAQQDPAAE